MYKLIDHRASQIFKGSSIKDFRAKGGGGLPNADDTVNFFACKTKRPKFADTGEGVSKMSNFTECPLLFMDGPNIALVSYIRK